MTENKNTKKKSTSRPLTKTMLETHGIYYGDIPPRHRPPSKPEEKDSGTDLLSKPT